MLGNFSAMAKCKDSSKDIQYCPRPDSLLFAFWELRRKQIVEYSSKDSATFNMKQVHSITSITSRCSI